MSTYKGSFARTKHQPVSQSTRRRLRGCDRVQWAVRTPTRDRRRSFARPVDRSCFQSEWRASATRRWFLTITCRCKKEPRTCPLYRYGFRRCHVANSGQPYALCTRKRFGPRNVVNETNDISLFQLGVDQSGILFACYSWSLREEIWRELNHDSKIDQVCGARLYMRYLWCALRPSLVTRREVLWLLA